MGLSGQKVTLRYTIAAEDFISAGEASSHVKKTLNKLGISHELVKRFTIAMYEAEINTVIHANGGEAYVEITPEKLMVRISDNGPGISDIEKAMMEGWSTAPEHIREMGFGAGMGLPNMKRYADELAVESEVGVGTVVTITVYLS